jgi:chromosome partitioning protein
MNIISLINQKGGVGKTTSTANIGAALAELNKGVLLIDLDPQANLSYSLGIQAHELESSVYELLKGEADLSGVLQHRGALDIIPASLDLAALDMELSGKIGRENQLKRVLKDLKNYDFILIDCPPSLGLLTINALTFSNKVFIVTQPEYLALKGMNKLLDTLEEIRDMELNTAIDLAGIVFTMYDSRKNLNREIIDKVTKHFGRLVFDTYIRSNVSLAEAPAQGKTIFEYKPGSRGAEDYLRLTTEILERMK